MSRMILQGEVKDGDTINVSVGSDDLLNFVAVSGPTTA